MTCLICDKPINHEGLCDDHTIEDEVRYQGLLWLGFTTEQIRARGLWEGAKK